MPWINIAVAVALVLLFLLLKRSGQISSDAAQSHLKNGALLIDVRTPAEYASGHLPNAINIPLDQIEANIPRRVQDKNKVLLLHCQSGMRSGMAKSKLKKLGYPNSFNLGSYARAEGIVR